jgi:hypothetical protein
MEDLQSTGSFAQYGQNFQEKIMQALLSDASWSEQLMEVFDPKFFDVKYLGFLADRYFAYAKKYKDFPSLQLLVTIIKDDLKAPGTDATLRDQIIDFIKKVQANPNPQDLPFVKDKTLDFCRKQALKTAIEKAIDLVATDRYEAIVEVVKNAVSVGTTPSLGHDLHEDAEARFVNIERRVVPTGIPQLDAKEVLQGGLGKGELGVVIAPTGVGKCSTADTYVCIKYTGIKINGKQYKPWDKITTKRGIVFARDIIETDELV